MVSAELDIWMGGARIGLLDGSDRRNLRLIYDDHWVEQSGSTPISVSMPLAGRSYSGQRVAAYLWGLLPDNDRVLERWASAYQCSATDVFGLLRALGNDVAGAAQYVTPGAPAEETTLGQIDPLTEIEVAEILRGLRADATAWHPNTRGRWSLAGAQAKLALAHDELTGTWGIPSGASPTTHILKPAIAGLAGHDLNEHLCLAAAGRLGLRVAQSRVLRFGEESALVVARFDRIWRDGAIMRIHQEDCCQALGVHPARKYQVEGGPSIEDIAGLLRDVEIGGADADVDALVRAAAFNWLVLGTDAHGKNYSLLLSGRQARLAPLYDLASAAPYGEHPKRLKLAQKVGGEYRPAFIARRHWEQLAITVGVDAERLCVNITEMAVCLPDALNEAIGAAGDAVGGSDGAQKLLDSVAAWAEICRRAMSSTASRT